ncbi:MAG: translation elongation factor Ts [Actinomycetota bacterium]|nr:translation elongation factor Ts [Actinomycetota bacterium]
MTVTATQVKELRDATGAGMMDCKRALEETDGDVEEARRLLRERGVASAARRAGRETTEGRVLARAEDGRAAIVAVACESEPVSKNEEFLRFAEELLAAVDADGAEAVERFEDERLDLAGRLGENLVVRGAARLEAQDGEVVSAYVHRPAEKIGVAVRMSGSPELARLLAMHVSFANPRYVARDEVPAEEVAAERAIFEKLPDVASKPEQVRSKIVDGMLGKRFFAENVLVDQPWIHDTSVTVGRALSEHGAEVREFVRYSVAG